MGPLTAHTIKLKGQELILLFSELVSNSLIDTALKTKLSGKKKCERGKAYIFAFIV